MLKYLLVILFFGCATTQKDINDVKQTEAAPDLLKTFDIKGKEFEKFQEAPAPTVPDKKVKTEVKATAPKAVEKNKDLSPVMEITPLPKSFTYPKGYPEQYKRYDEKFENIWKLFKANFAIGEQMVFDIKYFGITAGQAALTVLPEKMLGEKRAHHFHVKMTSAPFYKMIYEVNDYLDSYVDTSRFLPIKYMVVQRESKQDVDDLQLFDNDKLTTFFRFKRFKKKTSELKTESDQKFIPRFYQDSFSVLYFVRGLPLKVGETYEFPVITRAKPWFIKITPEKVESISTKFGRKDALKVNALTQYPGVLKANGEASFWLSNDERRSILKFEAKVKLGTIDGELVDYSEGK